MKQLTKLENSAAVILAIALALSALVPQARAVIPPPDGGYPNFTTAEGQNALQNLTTGSGNTAVGWYALFSTTDGGFNTAVGAGTLVLNNGNSNTATGTAALLLNTAGGNNTANGTAALVNNSIGNDNTAVGAFALNNNIASGNTAVGSGALFNNTTGSLNTVVGASALSSNTVGNDNTVMGLNALVSNIDGNNNTAIGRAAMGASTSAQNNTAVGWFALEHGGGANTAVGYQALRNSTGIFNTALGPSAGVNLTTGSNNIYIRHPGFDNEFDTIRIGLLAHERTFIGGIRGKTTGNMDAVNVVIDSDGQLGTVSSSSRFKEEIKPMDKSSETILALKPVTFRYKTDATNVPQFGLIAEEVAAVNPDLIVRDADGEIYTVRYDAVNAMLLNEFIKQHRKVQKLEAALNAVNTRLEEQAAHIQKVTAQIQVSKTERHVARRHQLNDRQQKSEIYEAGSE